MKKPLTMKGASRRWLLREPHRSGFGTLAAKPGCRAIIGPVPYATLDAMSFLRSYCFVGSPKTKDSYNHLKYST